MEGPHIFRASRGWKTFVTISTPLMSALFVWLMFLPWVEHREDETGFVIFCIAFGLGGVGFFLYMLVSTYRSRLEIHPDRVRDVGIFRTNELLFTEIEGYRILPTPYVASIDFVPKTPGTKRLHLALVYENKQALREWAVAHFPNLDEVRAKQELEEILSDPSIGSSEHARLEAVASAHKWTKALNGAALAAGAWGLFYPEPYQAAMVALLLLPLAAVTVQRVFPGIVKFDENPGDKSPNIAMAFLLPTSALAFRALQDWSVLSWEAFWLPFSLATAALFLLLQGASRDLKTSGLGKILALVFCAVYGYGSTMTVNCVFDESELTPYKANVLSKRRSSGRTVTYHLELGPWGPQTEAREVSVPSETYRKLASGDEATVVVGAGRLGIPWFYVQ